MRGSKTVRWEVEGSVVRDEVRGSIPQGWGWSRWRLIDVELITKVMEEVVRKAGQSAGGGETEVGGDEKVGQVLGGDLAGDGAVVAGRASVFQDGLVVGREPEELEDGALDALVGGAKVVERGVRFSESGETGEMKRGGRRVADGHEGAGGESQSGEQVMMRWGWGR